jgi:hypothetical protein
MTLDIKHLRKIYEDGDEANSGPEDPVSVILGAFPALLDEVERLRARRIPLHLVDKLEDLNHKASPGPWEQHYAANNAGCPLGSFKIPGHNEGKEVEMLADDAKLIVEVRNMLPELLTSLYGLLSPEDLNSSSKTPRNE